MSYDVAQKQVGLNTSNQTTTSTRLSSQEKVQTGKMESGVKVAPRNYKEEAKQAVTNELMENTGFKYQKLKLALESNPSMMARFEQSVNEKCEELKAKDKKLNDVHKENVQNDPSVSGKKTNKSRSHRVKRDTGSNRSTQKESVTGRQRIREANASKTKSKGKETDYGVSILSDETVVRGDRALKGQQPNPEKEHLGGQAISNGSMIGGDHRAQDLLHLTSKSEGENKTPEVKVTASADVVERRSIGKLKKELKSLSSFYSSTQNLYDGMSSINFKGEENAFKANLSSLSSKSNNSNVEVENMTKLLKEEYTFNLAHSTNKTQEVERFKTNAGSDCVTLYDTCEKFLKKLPHSDKKVELLSKINLARRDLVETGFSNSYAHSSYLEAQGQGNPLKVFITEMTSFVENCDIDWDKQENYNKLVGKLGMGELDDFVPLLNKREESKSNNLKSSIILTNTNFFMNGPGKANTEEKMNELRIGLNIQLENAQLAIVKSIITGNVSETHIEPLKEMYEQFKELTSIMEKVAPTSHSLSDQEKDQLKLQLTDLKERAEEIQKDLPAQPLELVFIAKSIKIVAGDYLKQWDQLG